MRFMEKKLEMLDLNLNLSKEKSIKSMQNCELSFKSCTTLPILQSRTCTHNNCNNN